MEIRFDVTIETIVSIVTSNLVGQIMPVKCWSSSGNHDKCFIQLGADLSVYFSESDCLTAIKAIHRIQFMVGNSWCGIFETLTQQ